MPSPPVISSCKRAFIESSTFALVSPADFSARFSAVNAETGMHRYNNHVVVIIPSHLKNAQFFLLFEEIFPHMQIIVPCLKNSFVCVTQYISKISFSNMEKTLYQPLDQYVSLSRKSAKCTIFTPLIFPPASSSSVTTYFG